MTIPASHIAEAQKLESDYLVKVYEVVLKKTATEIYFWNGPTTTWQGKTYSYLPCNQDKDAATSDTENSRPTLSIYNPEGVLTQLASEGEFDLALVTRKEILQEHFLSNTNIFTQRVWFISRIVSANRNQIAAELRSAIDIPNFNIPPRSFVPPEFPFLVY